MSQQSPKTPITLLQEYAVKHRFSPPAYEFFQDSSRTSSCSNQFHVRVKLDFVSAVGSASTKQAAKHQAASRALEILGGDPSDIKLAPPTSSSSEDDDHKKTEQNFVGQLLELCLQLHLPAPSFCECPPVGPPHCREFPYEVRVGALKSQARGGKKQVAKQLAAKDMFEQVRLVHVRDKCETDNNDDDVDMESESEDNSEEEDACAKEARQKKNLFVNAFDAKMKEKNIDVEDLHEYFRNRNKDSLFAIFNMLGVGLEIAMLQESPPMSCATFEIGIPYRLMAIGSSAPNAERNLIGRVYSFLDINLNVA